MNALLEAQSLETRQDEIDAAMEKFETLRLAYSESAGDDPPGIGLYRAAGDVVVAFARGPVPEKMAPVVSEVERLGLVLCEILNNVRQEKFNFDKDLPPQGIWSSWQNLQRSIREIDRPRPRLETVQELLKQGVSVPQIAKMHGLDEVQVLDEKEKPGSVCGPGYVPPIFAQESGPDPSTWSDGVVLSMLGSKIKALGCCNK